MKKKKKNKWGFELLRSKHHKIVINGIFPPVFFFKKRLEKSLFQRFFAILGLSPHGGG